MVDENQASFDADWAWVVATYQGKRSAFKTPVVSGRETFPRMSLWPDEFQASKLTLITFMPPNKFGVLAHPEDSCGVMEPGMWIARSEISQIRKPSKELVEQLDKAWAAEEDAPAIATSTDVSAAVRDAKARRAAAKAIAEGPRQG